MLLKKCYIGYYKEEVFVYLFINNSMSSICQLNKMAHIGVALFEALRQEPSRMCVCIYICTAQRHVHYIIRMEVSNLPQKTGLFLELNCSRGWSCSETWP